MVEDSTGTNEELFYVAQEYWRMVSQRSLFSERPIKIPAPRFVVFYNGM